MSLSNASPTSSLTPSAAATLSSSGSNGGLAGGFQAGATSFYKNLFYILVAVLAIFGCFSIFSWYRNRQRRRIIFDEARRLGLLVPGMLGYAAERERLLHIQLSGISSASGKPEIWDVYDQVMDNDEKNSKKRAVYDPPHATLAANIYPLSATPVPETMAPPPPFPISDLPRFPNNVAFLAPSVDREDGGEAATDWEAQVLEHASETQSSDLSKSRPKTIQISVLVRMPVEKMPRTGPVDEDAAVQEEWEGTEVGLLEVPVWVTRG